MRTISILSLFLVLLLHAGCSKDDGRPADMPKLYPVSISIIQDGKPLDGATVTLVAKTPAVAQYGRSAGTTVAGTVSLRTYGYNGVPAGEHAVLVEKRVTEGGQEIIEDERVVGTRGGRIYQLVDTKFTTEASTPLSITVQEKGKTSETFDVGAAVRVFLFERTSD